MSLVTTRDLTPTQRQALQQHRSFRASIRARAVPEKVITKPIEPRIEPEVRKPRPQKTPTPFVPWPVSTDTAWPVPHPITIDDIQKTICSTYRIPKLALLGPRRDRPVVIPRHIGMYLTKLLTSHSLPSIGRRFGNRDHTTALHGIRKMSRLMKTDENLAHEVALLIEKITGKQQ